MAFLKCSWKKWPQCGKCANSVYRIYLLVLMEVEGFESHNVRSAAPTWKWFCPLYIVGFWGFGIIDSIYSWGMSGQPAVESSRMWSCTTLGDGVQHLLEASKLADEEETELLKTIEDTQSYVQRFFCWLSCVIWNVTQVPTKDPGFCPRTRTLRRWTPLLVMSQKVHRCQPRPIGSASSHASLYIPWCYMHYMHTYIYIHKTNHPYLSMRPSLSLYTYTSRSIYIHGSIYVIISGPSIYVCPYAA